MCLRSRGLHFGEAMGRVAVEPAEADDDDEGEAVDGPAGEVHPLVLKAHHSFIPALSKGLSSGDAEDAAPGVEEAVEGDADDDEGEEGGDDAHDEEEERRDAPAHQQDLPAPQPLCP